MTQVANNIKLDSFFSKTIIDNNGKNCTDINDGLIKLFDMLNADCLFNEEYNIYFKSLSKMEIVLLSKYMEENYSEKELKTLFNDYMLSLSKEEQIEINKLKEKITDIC